VNLQPAPQQSWPVCKVTFEGFIITLFDIFSKIDDDYVKNV